MEEYAIGLSKQLIGPPTLEEEVKRVEQLEYVPNLEEFYPHLLTLLVCLMDEQDHPLPQFSAQKALEKILASPKASERRLQCQTPCNYENPKDLRINLTRERANSGSIWRPFGNEVKCLQLIDPRLLDPGVLTLSVTSHKNATYSIKKAFQESGFELKSPLYQYSLLARLDLNLKKTLAGLIISRLKVLESTSVSYGQRDETGTATYEGKKSALERLLLGEPKVTGRDWELVQGTEFLFGFWQFVDKFSFQLLVKMDPADHNRLAKIIKTAIFMHTSMRKYDERSTGLITQILRPIKNNNYEGAEAAIRKLVADNPNLWPDYICELFPLTVEERAQRQLEERLKSIEKANFKKIAAEKIEERKRLKLQKQRDPELLEKLRPCLGKVYQHDEEGTVFEIKDFVPDRPGLVKVTLYRRRPHGGLVRSGTFMSFSPVLDLIKGSHQVNLADANIPYKNEVE